MDNDPEDLPLSEASLREKSGIPADAEKVLIFAETSHWDPDWRYTSEEYYQKVEPGLLSALEELEHDPRRIYSLECIFFLRMFWERHDELQEQVRELVNARRLRLSGNGVTTPDTLLPDAEAILMDYLSGQEWLRLNGMTQEPRIAYLPDDFGHSPQLPALLNSLGIDGAAITRIDGSGFPGSDFRSSKKFPLPGSNAERLLSQEKSLDFIWQSSDGSELVCHWNAFTYFQGDTFATNGLPRWVSQALSFSSRSDAHIARQIEQFSAQLAPLSRTHYLFCPIGFDFAPPVRDIGSLIDRYNQVRYPETGIFVLNAGLDDYLQLVRCHRANLPCLAFDPNPHFMGFYASRPSLKRACQQAVRKLLLADRLSAAAQLDSSLPGLKPLKETWYQAALLNHHDFITGTATDRVYREEQAPWIEQVTRNASSSLSGYFQPNPVVSAAPDPALPQWSLEDGRLEVETTHYSLTLEADAGGCITRFMDRKTGEPVLLEGSNDIVSYYDNGGLWRMGHEFAGGLFREQASLSQGEASLSVREIANGIRVEITSLLEGHAVYRWLWVENDSRVIRMRVEASAGDKRTLVCRFQSPWKLQKALMDVPGGTVQRPSEHLYSPTFWAASSYACFEQAPLQGNLGLLFGVSSAVSFDEDGTIEHVVFRNANREMAYGFLPIPAFPATGHEPNPCRFDYALVLLEPGSRPESCLPQEAARLRDRIFLGDDLQQASLSVQSLIQTDHSGMYISALKPAWRGEGIIVRLIASDLPTACQVYHAARPVRGAFQCDARERDLQELLIRDGKAQVVPERTITTLRLLF
ncbi:MAG: hypothetical protein ACM3PY_00115 [Omnitrophica WOR_2 bacterium]